jgi:hypothetical protein
MHSHPGEPANPTLRPFLSFVRRPAFTASAPGKLTVWHWLGWQCLLMLTALLGGALDRILLRGMSVPLIVALLAIIAYGLVVLWRVARLRW